MNYLTKSDITEETLQWENFIPFNAGKLIIGTFPTAKQRRSFEFFYPNKNNPFWKVLASIAEMTVASADCSNAIQNRKDILTKLNLGITDMGYRVYRHANSSLDQSIFPIEFMNIFEILEDHPSIKKLIITSTSGQNSVEGWLRSYCVLNAIDFPKLKGKNPKNGVLLQNGKKIIEVVSVHSTSRAAAKTLEQLIYMYKSVLI